MTDPCIGWPADPPCPTYGRMHGCTLPDDHTAKRHRCTCGAIAYGNGPRSEAPCGTMAAVSRHKRNKERLDAACRAAENAYWQIRKERAA